MATTTTPCPHCQQLQQRLTALEHEVTAQQDTITQLREQLAAARNNSATSSRPPSSDIVKPLPASTATGQPRPLLPVEQLTDGVQSHYLELCPCCGQGLQPGTAAPQVVQQIDI